MFGVYYTFSEVLVYVKLVGTKYLTVCPLKYCIAPERFERFRIGLVQKLRFGQNTVIVCETWQ